VLLDLKAILMLVSLNRLVTSASAYAIHIQNNRHEYGAANDTLKLLQLCNKDMKMNCWEFLYIQIYRQHNRLITEQLANDINPLYASHAPFKTLHDKVLLSKEHQAHTQMGESNHVYT
jgi:hypothetical protein